MKKIAIIFLFTVINACKEENGTITPVVAKPCEIQEEDSDGYRYAYNFDTDGYMVSLSIHANKTTLTNKVVYSYTNKRLVSASDIKGSQWEFIYTNADLSGINFSTIAQKNYYAYTIERDENKRIKRITDAKGNVSETKYDVLGNSVEIEIKDPNGKQTYLRQRSDFDSKKSIHELFKGWQFDHTLDPSLVLYYPYFLVGGAGHAKKTKVFQNGKLTHDNQYEYEYNTRGFFTKYILTNKVTNEVYSSASTYTNCD